MIYIYVHNVIYASTGNRLILNLGGRIGQTHTINSSCTYAR